jgi:hypothetical protein
VLLVGVLLTVGVFVLEMSGRAARTAGSNRFRPLVFSVFPKAGQTVCQPIAPIPYDAARVSVLIGTYGRSRPPVRMTFHAGAGAVVAEAVAGAGRQGYLMMPLRRVSGASATLACLRIAGGSRFALGGLVAPLGPGAARLDGKPQPGDFTIFYYRHGQETWWQLLPVLDQRFGWGKAPFFGNWTLPAVAALVLLMWVGALRLALRAFR